MYLRSYARGLGPLIDDANRDVDFVNGRSREELDNAQGA
jgi:hypothetical protein